MKELVCIVCPRGCRLQVDEDNGYAVTGNSCPRGAEYGKNELQHPTRVLTTTVRVTGGVHRRLPVKTSTAIPKDLLFEAMEVANAVSVAAPVQPGQVIVENLLGTGADLIAGRGIEKG